MPVKDWLRTHVPRPIWERLRQARIRAGIRRFRPYVVEHTYGGAPLKISISDGLGQGWYDHDWKQLPEIELLLRGKLRPGALVFDCGAHQGVVALMISGHVAPAGQVVAVEGMAHNCQTARENARLNRAENLIQVVHAAVASEPGRLRFVDGLNGCVARDGVGTWVEAVTIDQLADRFGPPDVLFIDVEGFEGHALRGATKTLERVPDCYVEVHVGTGLEQTGDSSDTILSFFDDDKYEIFAWAVDDDQAPAPVDRQRLPDRRFALVALARW